MRLKFSYCVLFLRLLLIAQLSFPCLVNAASDKEVIEIERRADKVKPSLRVLSSDEVMLRELIKKFSSNISYEIENILQETSETTTRRAKISVRDASNIRIESSTGDGAEIISVYSGNGAWIYFPKTNILLDVPGKGKKDGNVDSQYDFIGGYIKNSDDYIVLKITDGAFSTYEITGPPGNTKATYRFGADGLPDRITFIEEGLGTREIRISNAVIGPVDEKLFKKPDNAIKMPLNEIPDIER